MPEPVATSSERQDEGANNQSLDPSNPGNVIEIGTGDDDGLPVATSSARQDEGANNQSLDPSNPGNEIDI